MLGDKFVLERPPIQAAQRVGRRHAQMADPLRPQCRGRVRLHPRCRQGRRSLRLQPGRLHAHLHLLPHRHAEARPQSYRCRDRQPDRWSRATASTNGLPLKSRSTSATACSPTSSSWAWASRCTISTTWSRRSDTIGDGDGISRSPKRRITVSTAGVAPKLKELGERTERHAGHHQLHATNDDLRNELVPINKKYNLERAVRRHPRLSGPVELRSVTFEYVMLKSVNDTPRPRRGTRSRLLKGVPAKINLIPFNPWPGTKYECSDWETIEAFAEVLNRAGYASPIRTPRGRDILAACGRLRSESVKEKSKRTPEEASRGEGSRGGIGAASAGRRETHDCSNNGTGAPRRVRCWARASSARRSSSYDFYIYATAASLVFGPLFFPSDSPSAQLMSSYATFAIAFIARPVGAVLFGHFGDRIGRKSTLVASLLLMGGSTFLIAFLPTYAMVRLDRAAAALHPALRPGPRPRRGVGRGGAAGGRERAARLEARASACSRSSGPRSGFIAANGLFLILGLMLPQEEFHRLGLAHPVPAQRAAGRRRPLGPPQAHRDAGVQGRARSRDARPPFRSANSSRTHWKENPRRHVRRGRLLLHLLSRDRLRARLRHRHARLRRATSSCRSSSVAILFTGRRHRLGRLLVATRRPHGWS